MARALEAKCLDKYVDPEDGETKPNPRISRRPVDNRPIGFINVRGIHITCDKYTRLPDGQRGIDIANYLAKLPYVHVRSVPKAETIEDGGLHPNIDVVTEAEYAKERADESKKAFEPKATAKVDAKTAIKPPKK